MHAFLMKLSNYFCFYSAHSRNISETQVETIKQISNKSDLIIYNLCCE